MNKKFLLPIIPLLWFINLNLQNKTVDLTESVKKEIKMIGEFDSWKSIQCIQEDWKNITINKTNWFFGKTINPRLKDDFNESKTYSKYEIVKKWKESNKVFDLLDCEVSE